jgi:hypothetical protein
MSTPMGHSTEKPENPSSIEQDISNEAAKSRTSSASYGPAGSNSGQKSEVEIAADKLYEERIEEEYAKREGGA